MDKVNILTSILGNYKRVGEEHCFNCPSDDSSHKGGDVDNKLNYNSNNNMFHCWVCGYGGHVMRLINDFGVSYNMDMLEILELEGDSQAKENIKKYYEVSLPNDTKIITKDNNKILYDYLVGRGFNDDSITYFKFSYSESNYYSGKVIIPSYNKNGKLNYYCLNDYNNKDNKYTHATYYDKLLKRNISIPKSDRIMNETNINWNSPLFVFEGAMDAYSMYPYTNTTYTYGKVVQDILLEEIINNKTPTFIVYDNDDKKAQQNALETVIFLRNNNVISDNIKIKTHKDYNLYVQKNENDKYKVFHKYIDKINF